MSVLTHMRSIRCCYHKEDSFANHKKRSYHIDVAENGGGSTLNLTIICIGS